MRGHQGRRARAVLAAAVLGMLIWVPAGCGGSGGSSRTTTHAFHLSPAEVESQHRAVLAERREVTDAELVSGRQGWARTGRGVLWTADGGRHWRTITPPTRKPLTALPGVWFRDPRNGWALAEEGHEGDTHPVFFSTLDGGRYWRRAPTPIRNPAPPGRRGVVLRGRRAPGLCPGQAGGGHRRGLRPPAPQRRRWAHLEPDPEVAAAGRPDRFESARDGWLAGGYPNPRLWRTEDSGLTWREVQVAPPPGVERVDSTSFLRPRIGSGGRGLRATDDGGRSWHPLGEVSVSAAAGWKQCPGRSDLRTRSLGCATASRVLESFFADGPKVDPGPSPAGWACRQHQGNRTSEGGDNFQDLCHSLRHPGRRLHLAWTTDLR